MMASGIPVRVYPRAGGGTTSERDALNGLQGLSPRRRGNPSIFRPIASSLGSIPAQAGEPILWSNIQTLKPVYPRAGGGTGVAAAACTMMPGLSPRRRGNRVAFRVVSG